jgi:polyisoprenyl-phosphate glycosyltransferase
MKLSVIVPVYRGKEILIELYRRINETLIGNYDFEVLFICDGCDSTSLRILKEIKKSNPTHTEIYRFSQNYGQHRALQYGFTRSTGDFIITIDEDLQHDPADIIKLIEKQREGDYDIVYGRFKNLKHNGIRNIISVVLRKILKHFIPTLYYNYSPYRLIKKDIADKTATMSCPYTFIDDFLSRVTQNIVFIEITHFKRFAGRSSYTISKLIKNGIFILLAYSKLALWLLVIALLILITGAFLFIIRILSTGVINTDFVNNVTLVSLFGTGLSLFVICLLAILINHRNMRFNTKPVELSNDDSI